MTPHNHRRRLVKDFFGGNKNTGGKKVVITVWFCIVCIVFIHLYSASCSAHQSEALPERVKQREEM